MNKEKSTASAEPLSELLRAYKFNNTYIRILESEKLERIIVQVTDNPRHWIAKSGEETYEAYRPLRRLEIGCSRLSISCVNHQQVILTKGPLLGMRIPVKQTEVTPAHENDGIHEVETSLEYRDRVIKGIRRVLNVSPQGKADIIEESISAFMK